MKTCETCGGNGYAVPFPTRRRGVLSYFGLGTDDEELQRRPCWRCNGAGQIEEYPAPPTVTAMPRWLLHDDVKPPAEGETTMTNQEPATAIGTPAPILPLPPNQETSGQLTQEDHERQTMIRAAATYDAIKKQVGELQVQVAEALLTIDSLRRQNQQLELLIATARNDASTYRNEADTARQERAEVLVSLANARAILERAGVPLPERRKRSNNGAPKEQAAAQ